MTTTADLDYWSLLVLRPDAGADQLKCAFRREARRWHPDLNGNDPVAEERFKLVNEAYAVLSDPKRRRAWEQGGDVEPPSADQPFATGFPSFEDYLDAVLGIPMDPQSPQMDPRDEPPVASPQPPPPVRADEDMESMVDLTPDQALYGTTVELSLADGTVVELQTPPQAGDGWRLRLEGVAPGGRDHFLQLRVMTPEGLRIDGLRVHYRLELFPPDAALGCAVDVPTLDGPVTLQVPPGSSSGRLLRLRGRGLRDIDTDRSGDQLVEIVVVIPADLGDAECALYRRLQELAAEGDPA